MRALHPVIELIHRRHTEGSLPGKRNDKHKLALAIEGGCMRGIVTGSMAGALDVLGLKHVFDVVYGSSAGSANGAYFISGQVGQGAAVYLEHINNRHFIDPWRVLRHRPFIDLEYVFQRALGELVAIDWLAVTRSPIPLRVLAANVATAEIDVLHNFTSKEDLLTALHASARMPWFSSGPLRYRGRHYFDSGILDPFCLRTALAEGNTHVLTLCGRPTRFLRSEPKFFKDRIANHLAGFNPKLASEYLAQFDPESNGAAVAMFSEEHPGSLPYITNVAPSADTPAIHDFECRRRYLLSGARAGVRALVRTLGYFPEDANRVLRSFGRDFLASRR